MLLKHIWGYREWRGTIIKKLKVVLNFFEIIFDEGCKYIYILAELKIKCIVKDMSKA